MKALISAIAFILILGLGAVWLHAMPQAVSPVAEQQNDIGFPKPAAYTLGTTTLASAQIEKSNTTSTNTLATTTPIHSIDWVAISPSSISSGSNNPVTITALISDPAVIRNRVNLIYISPTGTSQIIGSLNDDGLNGDALAGDDIFTIVTSFAQFPVGTINLRISATFLGGSPPVQTGLFQLNVLPPLSTVGWTTLTDTQHLFSIQVPPKWNLVLAERTGDDAGTIKNVDFEFPDGNIVFTVSVQTTSSLAAIQYGDGPQPILLGQTGQYLFAVSETQVAIESEVVSWEEISQALPQILATFRTL